MSYMDDLGQRLAELRGENGWSQERAAHEVGVSERTWRSWETGKRWPQPDNWERLAVVFGDEVARRMREPDGPDRLAMLEARIIELERQVAILRDEPD